MPSRVKKERKPATKKERKPDGVSTTKFFQPRNRRDVRRFTVYLSKPVAEELDSLADECACTLSQVVEDAIVTFSLVSKPSILKERKLRLQNGS